MRFLPFRAEVGMSCQKVQCAHCIWVLLGRVCELGKQLAQRVCWEGSFKGK